MTQSKFTSRPIGQAELPLVYDSWIRSFKSSPWAGCLPNNVAATIIRGSIVDLVNAGAHLRGIFLGEECVAWVCEDMLNDIPIVHFAYVKAAHDTPENFGVLREAIAPPEGYYTYKTTWLRDFLGEGFQHRPSIARSRSAPRR